MLCRLGLHKFVKISVYLRKCVKCGRIEYQTVAGDWINIEELSSFEELDAKWWEEHS